MKNKIKKSFFIVGVLTGLSAAFVPMTTYGASQTADSHVEVTVMPAITLEITIDGEEGGEGSEGGEGGDVTQEKKVIFDNPVLGTTSEAGFTATVSTNQAYTLSLNALDGQTDLLPAGVSSENAPIGGKIPGTGEIVDGKTSWGVKLASVADYSAVPATITKFYEGADPVQAEETQFKVGLAAGTDLLNGTYSSTLVVTAATK